jgi:hypothetical protein
VQFESGQFTKCFLISLALLATRLGEISWCTRLFRNTEGMILMTPKKKNYIIFIKKITVSYVKYSIVHFILYILLQYI